MDDEEYLDEGAPYGEDDYEEVFEVDESESPARGGAVPPPPPPPDRDRPIAAQQASSGGADEAGASAAEPEAAPTRRKAEDQRAQAQAFAPYREQIASREREKITTASSSGTRGTGSVRAIIEPPTKVAPKPFSWDIAAPAPSGGASEDSFASRKVMSRLPRSKPLLPKAASPAKPTPAAPSGRPFAHLSKAVSAEHLAWERLQRIKTRAQKELRRAVSVATVEAVREKKREEGERVRAQMARLVGRDMTDKLRAVEPATDADMVKFSETLNTLMATYHPSARNFYSVFKTMDIDGSRRVSFKEFSIMVREQLRASKAELPQARLHALWRALDSDSSGYVDAGELGRFMKLGKAAAGASSRQRLRAANSVVVAAVRADTHAKRGTDLTHALVDVVPAPEEEVRYLSELFNAQLLQFDPDARNFYTLFKHMDVDRTGRISFQELQRMVREELKLSMNTMPRARLLALWKSLDEDASGYICAGEFGRFMRASDGKRVAPLDARVAETREKNGRRQQDELKRKEEDWTRRAARKAEANARALEAEAARLEAALNEAGSSLPAIGTGRGITSSKSAPALRKGAHAASRASVEAGARAEALQKLARDVAGSVGRSARVMHEM